MPEPKSMGDTNVDLCTQLDSLGIELDYQPGIMFRGTVVYLDNILDAADVEFAKLIIGFGHGEISLDLDSMTVTHVVTGQDAIRLQEIRDAMSR
jgi:hypothetical protein